MATQTTPDIEILVGLQGGASISSGSGKLIRDQIEGIIKQINGQKLTEIKLDVDRGYIINQINSVTKNPTGNVQLNIDQTHLQNQVTTAVQNMSPVDLKVNLKPQDNGGGGSGGGTKGTTSDLQKIGSLVAQINQKKLKLLDADATSKEAAEIRNQINDLQVRMGTAINQYKTSSGKQLPEIRQEVAGLDTVIKSVNTYNLKVATLNDTYDELIKKIRATKTEHDKVFDSNQVLYGTSADAAIQEQWAKYEKEYLANKQNAESRLGGKFNSLDSKDQLQQLQSIIKKYTELDKLLKTLKSTSAKNVSVNENGTLAVAKYAENIYEFYKKIKDTAPADMTKRVLDLFNEAAEGNYGDDINALIKRFTTLRNEVYKAQADVETFGQKIARVFKQKIGYGIMAAAAMQARRALNQLYTNVVEMDSAMTQLRIVTDDSGTAYEKFATKAAKAARSIGASITDIMKSSETYARLGYSLEESLNLSATTAQLANVADTDAETATTFMTSILKGFGKSASEAQGIGDMLTLVGKKYAISAEELGAALERGGASMAAANNTLEESIALLAAGNAAVQDAESVGTAFKTTTMRIRGSSTEELEEAGLATDGLCESTSKLRKEIKALSGVDIMLNEDTYKSTYQILLEIAQVWDRLSDINQATLLEDLAGKRNSQVLMSVIQNIDDLKGAYADAQNAAGTMADATEKYLDSISGKTDKLSASYQDLSSRVLDTSIIKVFLDLSTIVFDTFNQIDEASKGAVSNMMSVSVAGLGLITIFQTLKKVATVNSVAATITSIGASLTSLPGIAMLAGIAIAGIGTYAYQAYKEGHPALEDLKSDLEDLRSVADESKNTLQENAHRIAELQSLADNGTITFAEQSELSKLKEENALLKQQYQIQQSLIDQKEADVQDAAKSKVERFLAPGTDIYAGAAVANHNNSGVEQLQEDIDQYKLALQAISDEYANAAQENRDINQKIIDEQESIRDNRANRLQETTNTIISMMQDLNPEEVQLKRELQTLLDKIQITIGGSSAVKEVAQNTLESQYFSSATQKLKDLANAGNLTEEAVNGLNDALVNELITYLTEMCGFSWDNLGELSNQLKDAEVASVDLSVSLKGVTDDLKAMTDKYDLLYSVQEDFNKTGSMSADTLSSIAEKYPELESSIGLYIAGIKTGKELLSDMTAAYQNDVAAYKKALASKLSASPEFYNSLSDKQKTYINDLAKSYGIDLKNFKDLETAKLKFQSEIIAKLASNYSQYTGASVEQLKQSQVSLESALKWTSDPAKRASMQAELTAVTGTLASLIKYQNALDEIALNGVKYDPEKYSPDKISDDSKSSSSTDTYKKNLEKQIKILKHKREMDLITERDYYNGLREIQNAYKIDEKKYQEEIWDLEQEIFNGMRDLRSDWISDQEKMADNLSLVGSIDQQRQIYDSILKEVETAIDDAHKYGLDENSDYVQELRDQYHKTCQDILNMVKDAYDDFRSYADDFNMWNTFDFTQLDVLEDELRKIQSLYDSGKMGWAEYVEAWNDVAKDLYDTKQDSIESIIDMTMEMIEQEANDEIDALDEQIDKFGEIIDLKKKLLQDTKDEKDHEQEVADAVNEIAKLQSKISQLSLDDSREAIAKRAELEEQLATKQKELADIQGDYTLDKTLDVLDETKDAKEDEAEAEKKAIEKSIDSWVKKYKLAINRIDNDWDNLYDDLNDWMEEHRSSIDGPDSLKTAWENVDQMVRQTGQDIESIYNGNGSVGINPYDPQSILDAMKKNSEIAQANGTRWYNGVDLNQENYKLAARYEAATGIHLTYDSSKGWLLPNGSLAYTVNGSSSGSSVGTSSAVPSTATGSIYQATVNKYGAEPTGTLKIGSSGDDVKWLQYYLKQLGYFNYTVDGTFYTRTEEALKLFQKMAGLTQDGIYGSKTRSAMRKYHTGGIVDGTGALNDKEVLAILQKGELVLDDKRKANLRSVFSGLKDMLSMMTRTSVLPYPGQRVMPIGSGGNTFAPQISVAISHNGKMTDNDAKRYGEIAADATLEKLRSAFNKRGL